MRNVLTLCGEQIFSFLHSVLWPSAGASPPGLDRYGAHPSHSDNIT